VIRTIIKNIPVIRHLALTYKIKRFAGSFSFWEERYRGGGQSGVGSYNHLAAFKAEVLNDFVNKHDIQTVIEFGCGDGNQLALANYPSYIGLDVSPYIIEQCKHQFANDQSKSFYVYHSKAFVDHAQLFRAELSLSLDVIFHLIEDDIYHAYMTHLFDAAEKYVIIYSSNFDKRTMPHVLHREFSKWVAIHRPDWALIEHIPNRYPWNPRDKQNTSHSEFFIYTQTRV